jgi:flagellar basal-body rod modification protein FlgD
MSNSIDTGILNQLGFTGRLPGATQDPDEELGQEDFMRLLIAQLSNQDPFQPMQNGEYLSQLAQFGTVSGISELKGSIEALAGSLSGNQALQAANLVEREVLVPAREAWLPPEGRIRGAVDVPAGARRVTIEVVDLRGRAVTQIPVEGGQAGLRDFAWDGTLPGGSSANPGFYQLRAVADYGDRSESLDVLVSGRVESVALGGVNGSVALTVTGLGTVDLSRVREIG